MEKKKHIPTDLESLVDTIMQDWTIQLDRAESDWILPEELHSIALNSKNKAVREAVARNPKTLFSTHSFLILSSPDDDLLEILSSTVSHPESLGLLLDKLQSRVRENPLLASAYARVYARLELVDPVGVALKKK